MHRGRTTGKHKLGFVAFDSAKEKHAVAIADGGRDGEVRYLGEIDNSPDAVRKLVAKLSRQYERLHFCYEAGPTGYGLHRQLTDLGHVCDVIAPTMIPKRSGDRVKTNRRDSVTLVKLLRAGLRPSLTTDIRVPPNRKWSWRGFQSCHKGSRALERSQRHYIP
jgi:transposase